MTHFASLGKTLAVGFGTFYVVSMFHAAAVEVSRKPRLAAVTPQRPTAILEAEEPQLAIAA